MSSDHQQSSEKRIGTDEQQQQFRLHVLQAVRNAISEENIEAFDQEAEHFPPKSEKFVAWEKTTLAPDQVGNTTTGSTRKSFGQVETVSTSVSLKHRSLVANEHASPLLQIAIATNCLQHAPKKRKDIIEENEGIEEAPEYAHLLDGKYVAHELDYIGPTIHQLIEESLLPKQFTKGEIDRRTLAPPPGEYVATMTYSGSLEGESEDIIQDKEYGYEMKINRADLEALRSHLDQEIEKLSTPSAQTRPNQITLDPRAEAQDQEPRL